MKEWQSSAHVKWECKYHIVIVPKYRKKVMYGRTRKEIGKIVRQLCRQKDVELVEGHAMPDHIPAILIMPHSYDRVVVQQLHAGWWRGWRTVASGTNRWGGHFLRRRRPPCGDEY